MSKSLIRDFKDELTALLALERAARAFLDDRSKSYDLRTAIENLDTLRSSQ